MICASNSECCSNFQNYVLLPFSSFFDHHIIILCRRSFISIHLVDFLNKFLRNFFKDLWEGKCSFVF